MKNLLLLSLILVFAASCSTFDKWKTPVAADGGVPPGEKSSYLLNKPDSTATQTDTATSVKKKKKKKKVAPSTTPSN
jgi:hypothetical protein